MTSIYFSFWSYKILHSLFQKEMFPQFPNNLLFAVCHKIACRQTTKKDECNKRLWHVFVLLNIRLWNYYSLMCSNCGCCYVTTTDHYHSKRHTLKNTHSIIEKPCETQTDNPSHVLGCFNVSRKKKKIEWKKVAFSSSQVCEVHCGLPIALHWSLFAWFRAKACDESIGV